MENEMKLERLSLRNFKGVKEFTFEPGGEDIAVYGDNATGKTTLADAWFWLLFGKDSLNKTDFEIKTLENGAPVHGLEHEVEGVLLLGDAALTLRKVYSENWTKKRGSPSKEFTGHSTDYCIDGVPVKKNEYEAKISLIVDEDAFKLLTNPRHFNEVLHWQERRKVLLEVCGDVKDEDVIASDGALASLPDILNGHKLEDHRKIVMAKRTEINKELAMIPVRIDETQRGLPGEREGEAEVQSLLSSLRNDSAGISQRIATLVAGGGVAVKNIELREVEAEQMKLQKNHWVKSAGETQKAKAELRRLEDKIREIEARIGTNQRLSTEASEEVTLNENKLVSLREKYAAVYGEEFAFEQSDTCPTCGQALPVAQLDAAREKAQADFNLSKAERLEEIVAEGNAIKFRKERASAQDVRLMTEGSNAHTELVAATHEAARAEETVASLEQAETDYAKTPAYLQLEEKKGAIEQQIEELKAASTEEVDRAIAARQATDVSIAEYEATIAEIQQRASGLQRIEDLKHQEKLLAAEFEKMEQELYLTEQFVRTKVQLLEGKINSKFEMARFKMFDEQVNGAIAECCETTYHGSPYATALSNSERINIGLDIINTLSEHYQFVAPIWVDNCEAVARLLPTKGQQIKLYVSEADKVLRIKKED